MKKLIAAIAVTTSIMASCQSDSKKYTTVDSTIMSDQQADYKEPDECFSYNDKNGGGSASLRIYGTGYNKVLGKITYTLSGKDKNDGEFTGITKGDTIIVNYKFKSEGVYSNRQVAWLRQGDQLLEGYGDIYEVNNSVKFKDISKLTFGKSIIFDKVECKE
ncbi:hypothetical protein [Pedobacter aquatilis]|uniref:hypothetical protein n=1 Tax=Pedobacter aquatilis TaxID=351343 RepID=UPI00292FC518|nr:hypothetical protein [Pedobacter aquatilis]